MNSSTSVKYKLQTSSGDTHGIINDRIQAETICQTKQLKNPDAFSSGNTHGIINDRIEDEIVFQIKHLTKPNRSFKSN